MTQDEPNSSMAIEVPDMRTLNILYTNDIKGQAEQMAYLSTVVKNIRQEEDYTLLLDSGNWAKGTLLSDQFKGIPMVEIFSVIKYDAVGLGEGEISFGSNNLYMLEEKADFPMVSCNIVEEGTGIAPYFIKKYAIIEKGPFKTAIMGISLPREYPASGFTVRDPFSVLPDVIKEVKTHNPDLIILLSRMGLDTDRKIAEKFEDINIIVGGRDCVNMEEPLKVSDTYLCQAGEKAQYVGSLAIDMESIIRITPVEPEESQE